MTITFTLAVAIVLLTLLAAVSLSSLPQLFAASRATTEQLLSHLVLQEMTIAASRLEDVFNESSRAVMSLSNSSSRLGSPFSPGETPSERKRRDQLWTSLLSSHIMRMPEYSSLNVRFAEDSTSIVALHGEDIVKTQMCQSAFRVFPANVLQDQLENCSSTVFIPSTQTSLPKKHPLVVDVWKVMYTNGYLGPLWNASYNALRPTAASGWQPQQRAGVLLTPVPLFSGATRQTEKGVEVFQHFTISIGSMSFVDGTDTPIANFLAQVVVSRFGPILQDVIGLNNITANDGDNTGAQQQQQGSSHSKFGQDEEEELLRESRAFLVDGAGRVLGSSHGDILEKRNLTDPVPFNCFAWNNVMGCLFNVSDYPEYELLRLAGVQSSPTTSDISNIDVIFDHKPRAITRLSDGAEFMGYSQRLRSDVVGFEYHVFIFIPFEVFARDVVHARTVSIAVVVVLSLVGAALGYGLVRLTTHSVAKLAKKMQRDPFKAELKSAPSSSKPTSTAASSEDNNNKSSSNSPTSSSTTSSSSIGAIGGCFSRVADCILQVFNEPTEVAELEAEFAAFRAIIDQLRGFVLLPTSPNARRKQHAVSAAVLMDSVDSAGGPSDSTDLATSGKLSKKSGRRIGSVRFAESTAAADADDQAQLQMMSASPVVVNVKRRRPNLAAELPLCFVAVVFVPGFQLGPEQQEQQQQNQSFVDLTQFVVESLHYLAMSVGSSLIDFHADSFLFAAQIRDTTKTKIPTRFVARLMQFARVFRKRRQQQEQQQQPEEEPPFEVCAGLSTGHARLVVQDDTDDGNISRPRTFFGAGFTEAFAVERVMRNFAGPMLQPDKQEMRQKISAEAILESRRCGGQYRGATVVEDESEGDAGAGLTESGEDDGEIAAAGEQLCDEMFADDLEMSEERRADAARVRNLRASMLANNNRAVAAATLGEKQQQREQQVQQQQFLPHCIGMAGRRHDELFEAVRSVPVELPVLEAGPFLRDMSGGFGTCTRSLSRPTQQVVRLLDVKRVSKPNRILPVAPL